MVYKTLDQHLLLVCGRQLQFSVEFDPGVYILWLGGVQKKLLS